MLHQGYPIVHILPQLLFPFFPTYPPIFPSSLPLILPPPLSLASFLPLSSVSPHLSPILLSLSHIYMYIYIFPELFENILHILCPFTSKYFSMYLLKTRTFSYIITVQLPTSGHLILDYLISNSSMFSISPTKFFMVFPPLYRIHSKITYYSFIDFYFFKCFFLEGGWILILLFF